MIIKFKLFLTGILLLIYTGLSAFESGWWNENENTNESSEQSITANYSAVNQGQLMNASLLAADEIKKSYPLGEALTALIENLEAYMSHSPNATPEQIESNYLGVNIGQLKHVSSIIYDRLSEIEKVTPGSVQWPEGVQFQSGGSENDAHKYPWPETMPENMDENHSLANIGQLKFLFSWSLKNVSDVNDNGIDDRWELEFFGDLDTVTVDSDYDKDSILDIDEWKNGTNPRDIRFISPATGSTFLTDVHINLWLNVPDADKMLSVVIYRNGQQIVEFGRNEVAYVHLDEKGLPAGMYEYTAIGIYDETYPFDSTETSIIVYKQDTRPPAIDPWDPGDNDGENGSLPALPGDSYELSIQNRNDYMGGLQAFFVATNDEEYVEDNQIHSFPKPTICIVEVVATSQEYPYWTDQQSKYNDNISWIIKPSWGGTFSGSVNVNSLNSYFDENGKCVVGRYIFIMPSDADSPSIIFTGGVQNIGDGILDSSVTFNIVEIEMTSDSIAGDGEMRSVKYQNPWHFNPTGTPKWKFTDNSNQYAVKSINEMD